MNRSFAHMAVVSLVGCRFCMDFGYFIAHDEGLDLAKVREVPRWRESAISFVIEGGRIRRLYVIRNPRKMRRLEEAAELRR